ncbi:MAG: DUF6785 family protein [Phycisphaeraceae bacterium]
MSIRAVVMGLVLGLIIAGATYFNDYVIGQTMLLGHHLPVLVFGVACVVLFAVNPLLRGVRASLPLSAGEVAVMAAIALAACGWPGNSFYRSFSTVVALPGYWVQNQAQWQASDVMSFVPGGSGALAQEHVLDAPRLAGDLLRASVAGGVTGGEAGDAGRPVLARIWESMEPEERRQVRRVAGGDEREVRYLLAALNRALAQPELYDAEAFAAVDVPAGVLDAVEQAQAGTLTRWRVVRANRALLAAALPGQIMPAPAGEGVLFAGGDPHEPTLDLMLTGRQGDERLGLRDIDWQRWWPTLRLWGGTALCMGLASLCLALIVHPQWSRREMLPYPIARFVREVARSDQGGWLPDVARNRGFWLAAAAMLAMHSLNGMQVMVDWLPSNLHVPLRWDFGPMRELFPNASRVYGSHAYFEPFIFPTVMAFSLFLTTSVSFSLGIAHLLFMLLGATLIANGIPLDRDYIGASKINTMAFGAFLAMSLMILYIGRRYYANVAGSMLGLRRDDATPAYATWAGWGLVASIAAAVAVLHTAGLAWPLGAALMLLVMLKFLVMSRIAAETGAFLIKPGWWPVGILVALVGFEALGPAAYIVLALATLILVGEAREAIMPYLTNGLKLAEQAGGKAGEQADPDSGPRRIIPWKGLMIVASLVVAGAVTLVIQHNVGVNREGFVTMLSRVGFDQLARQVAESRSLNTLAESVTATGVERLGLISPDASQLGWMGVGFMLVIVTASARLRLPWWPLHPVIFLVWGTWPMFMFSFSFMVGWLIKVAVVRLGGARAYHAAVPIAVGVIFGEIISAFAWSALGAVNYFITGVPPETYWNFRY